MREKMRVLHAEARHHDVEGVCLSVAIRVGQHEHIRRARHNRLVAQHADAERRVDRQILIEHRGAIRLPVRIGVLEDHDAIAASHRGLRQHLRGTGDVRCELAVGDRLVTESDRDSPAIRSVLRPVYIEQGIIPEAPEVLDRGVLDRISAPLEHLLRNAIAHGIEAPEGRREAGKAEAGELLIEVRQEGNEVVLVMSDDGAGLNIERIREKAISLALMRPDEILTDQQIGNFIFRSGFSTAGAVTAVAGRGVGMDVVMSEITALGGRVGTAFVRGKGTTFTIHLPLTLSVLQGVVFRLGGNLYAVPTMMVEQLQRPKMDVLAAAQGAGMVEWQGKQYPFHQLRDLMELPPDEEEQTRFGSVLLLRSGSHRVGIRVDDIVGGQEIVIKNIGPQLARVPGVTGAAVLGSGETVLILNPVQLALRAEEKARNTPAPAAPGVPAAPAAPVAAEPARQRIVLVVDDSLTVRKITGRLLSREGYNVVVAKDGVEALEKLQEQRPDVMITDVEMPRMDGFDLTKNVREDASLKGLPIIMITSRTADKHREHAAELGVDVFLGKPYEESDLLGHIKTLAARPLVA